MVLVFVGFFTGGSGEGQQDRVLVTARISGLIWRVEQPVHCYPSLSLNAMRRVVTRTYIFARTDSPVLAFA